MNLKYGKLMTIVQFACGVNMFFKIDPLIAKLTKRKPFHVFANRDDTRLEGCSFEVGIVQK
jgi:hypothetical protein